MFSVFSMTYDFGVHHLYFTLCNHLISLIGSSFNLIFSVGFTKFQYLDLLSLPFTPSSSEMYLFIRLKLSCSSPSNYMLNPSISTKLQILYFSFHLNISLWMVYWHCKFKIFIIKCMISPINLQ